LSIAFTRRARHEFHFYNQSVCPPFCFSFYIPAQIGVSDTSIPSAEIKHTPTSFLASAEAVSDLALGIKNKIKGIYIYTRPVAIT
jgi:hypothetical protein